MGEFSPGRAIKSRKRGDFARIRRAASRNGGAALCVSLGEVTGQEDLQKQDGRDTVFEFGVLGLVVPGAHAAPGPDAATDQRQPHQRTLGDAPLVGLGLPLIETENKESDDVDTYQVVNCIFRHSDFHFRQRYDFLADLWCMKGDNALSLSKKTRPA